MKGVKMYDRLSKTMMEEYSHEYIIMLGEKIWKWNIQIFKCLQTTCLEFKDLQNSNQTEFMSNHSLEAKGI